jgi:hypothetical protein
MELKLERDELREDCTLGKLFVDNVFFCYVVEDKVRPEKIKAVTAIPYGRYKVIVNMSNRFKKLMPLLIDVPFFEGVRIHAGNTAKDTEGCLIVGMARTENGVGLSRVAFTKLMEKLKGQNNIYITIV